jgi:hypothetical protein
MTFFHISFSDNHNFLYYFNLIISYNCIFKINISFYFKNIIIKCLNILWGLGIGDWGLGIGDLGQ